MGFGQEYTVSDLFYFFQLASHLIMKQFQQFIIRYQISLQTLLKIFMINKDNQALITLLLKETEQSSYFQKYQKWKDLMSKTPPEDSLSILTRFLQYFPFNFEEWMQYIQLTGPQSYQLALKRNPKSFQLWQKYLQHLRKDSSQNEGYQKYKKEVINAIRQIGADIRTTSLYQEYYTMLDDKYHYDFYKKIFSRALIDLEKIYEKFEEWIQLLSEQQLQILVAKQTKGKIVRDIEPKTFIKDQIYRTYSKTLRYRKVRIDLQKQIKHFYFGGTEQELAQDMKIWKELIEVERQNGVIQNTSYCYQRMLMAQTHDIELWEQVFHYLQNETNKYSKVLSLFRFNSTFFMQFNVDLYLYWCDLEERQNPTQARKMYIQLTKYNRKLQVFLRHIQFEIRQKQWDNAKTIFDTLVVQYQSDSQKLQYLPYILVQYTNYVIKHYKDYDYPKKLLKQYFQYLPYNDYLFTNYLQFMKNYENKQGYYDELMEIIITGLKKAKANTSIDFNKVMKMVKHYLRSVLSSIYLIKMAQRKMIQFDQKNHHNTST